jgi:hypothetical protein
MTAVVKEVLQICGNPLVLVWEPCYETVDCASLCTYFTERSCGYGVPSSILVRCPSSGAFSCTASTLGDSGTFLLLSMSDSDVEETIFPFSAT